MATGNVWTKSAIASTLILTHQTEGREAGEREAV
jgi:hypothetical protein